MQWRGPGFFGSRMLGKYDQLGRTVNGSGNYHQALWLPLVVNAHLGLFSGKYIAICNYE